MDKKPFLAIVFLVIVAIPTFSMAAKERLAFTATTVTRSYDSGGAQHSKDIVTFARRSDGSSATLTSRTRDHQGIDSAHIVDLPRNERLSVYYLTESTISTTLSQPPRSLDCREDVLISPVEVEQILGFDVVKVSKEVEGTEGHAWVIEKWLAPQLDCFPLKKAYTRHHPDNQRGQRNESEVVSVVLGEPHAQLFLVPSDFTERSPSEVYLESERLRGIQCGEECQERRSRHMEFVDAGYYARQP